MRIMAVEEVRALIRIIKTGSRAQVKAARKEVERLWARACREPELWPAFSVFAAEARDYGRIPDLEHKLAFLNTLKWPFLGEEIENFDFWPGFLLARVQEPEGKVRLAAVRAAEYLAVSMLSCFDTPGGLKFRDLSPEVRAGVRRQFFAFAMGADELARKHRTPALERYKYIDSLPPGVYKSCQQLLNQSLLTTPELKAGLLAFMREKSIPNIFSSHPPGRA